jgi:hypothetical protein
MRRILALTTTILLSLGAAGTSTASLPAVPTSVTVVAPSVPGARSWADAQIQVVTSVGILGTDPASFRPNDPLTRGELAFALAAWGKRVATPGGPDRLVTIRELDAQLVGVLGLTGAAKRIRSAAQIAGLGPTGMLGTETVVRLLGLRFNHPQAQDELELLPNQPATRAEAAYSFARALKLSAGQVTLLDNLSQTFSVPEISELQRTVLTRALRFVGYPYVWAGTSESTQKLWSATAPGGTVTLPGGFDCSGFVWRVYKTKSYPGAPLLSDMLKGRTTYSMSGEVKKSARIAINKLQPGDVVFFGNNGTRSTPAEVGHSGIYVGNGWFAHSSSAGVTLQPLGGWYTKTFAWARRPLAEAGLL